MNGKEKLEFLDVSAITAFITAVIGDILSLFGIAGVVPIIGLPILFFALSAHYLAGLAVGVFVFKKLSGFMPKVILAIGIILPLPTLLLALIIAMLFQSKVVQTIGIAAIGLATGGAGAIAAEGGAAAAGSTVAAEEAVAVSATEGAAAGVEGTGAARAAAGVEKGTAAAEEEAGGAGPEAGRRKVSPEELGEEPEAMEELQRRLFEGTPSGQTEEENEEDEEGGVYVDGNDVDLRGSQ
ncbi:MAG TPA: hypothetical protein VMV71_01660 [Candidatus Paceibacterota bacterium]|nr:hypothetical protein [Candidatus Paceibacterota bacterium]